MAPGASLDLFSTTKGGERSRLACRLLDVWNRSAIKRKHFERSLQPLPVNHQKRSVLPITVILGLREDSGPEPGPGRPPAHLQTDHGNNRGSGRGLTCPPSSPKLSRCCWGRGHGGCHVPKAVTGRHVGPSLDSCHPCKAWWASGPLGSQHQGEPRTQCTWRKPWNQPARKRGNEEVVVTLQGVAFYSSAADLDMSPAVPLAVRVYLRPGKSCPWVMSHPSRCLIRHIFNGHPKYSRRGGPDLHRACSPIHAATLSCTCTLNIAS